MNFFETLIQDIKNKTLNGLICGAAADKEGALQALKVMEAFNKRGISTETVIEAICEGMGQSSPMNPNPESRPAPSKNQRFFGCEFCDNGEHLATYDKYGNHIDLEFCPVCGRRLGEG